jgi:rhodanese-related sulfurtransferase
MSVFSNVAATDWETWVEENGAIVLDVREADEWELGTLPGAVLISQGEVVSRMDELPKDRPVLCVCRSGGRSANVAGFLAFNGYESANLAGGMKALGMQD